MDESFHRRKNERATIDMVRERYIAYWELNDIGKRDLFHVKKVSKYGYIHFLTTATDLIPSFHVPLGRGTVLLSRGSGQFLCKSNIDLKSYNLRQECTVSRLIRIERTEDITSPHEFVTQNGACSHLESFSASIERNTQ